MTLGPASLGFDAGRVSLHSKELLLHPAEEQQQQQATSAPVIVIIVTNNGIVELTGILFTLRCAAPAHSLARNVSGWLDMQACRPATQAALRQKQQSGRQSCYKTLTCNNPDTPHKERVVTCTHNPERVPPGGIHPVGHNRVHHSHSLTVATALRCPADGPMRSPQVIILWHPTGYCPGGATLSIRAVSGLHNPQRVLTASDDSPTHLTHSHCTGHRTSRHIVFCSSANHRRPYLPHLHTLPTDTMHLFAHTTPQHTTTHHSGDGAADTKGPSCLQKPSKQS